jgi:hypothetical protein
MRPRLSELNRRQLFFTYCMDCQTPTKPGGGRDQTWEVAEKAVAGLTELFAERHLEPALGFASEPEVARRHAALFHQARQLGGWVALHFQARGYRPPGASEDLPWDRPLSDYGYDEQKALLTVATDDWQQSMGLRPDTFGACCAQANDYTHAILAELGYHQCYTTVPGRYNASAGQRWWGAFPHSHHCSSRSRLVPGELDLYEVPFTHTLVPQPGSAPDTWVSLDYRAEYEKGFDDTMAIAAASVEDMIRRDHPVLYLYVLTHNTWDVGDRRSGRRKAVGTAIDVACALATRLGLGLMPVSLAQLHQEADRLNAY